MVNCTLKMMHINISKFYYTRYCCEHLATNDLYWQRLSLTKLEAGSSESFFWLGPDLGLCPSFRALPAYSRFSKNLAESVNPLLSVSDHPGLLSAKILPCPFSQNLPYPWCFLLAIFNPQIPTLYLSYKSPLFHTVFIVELNSPLLQNPTVAVLLN